MPLVISAPWLPQSVGLRSSSIVELVDIFPTTVALAGLKPPPGETLDGTSLAPLLSKPLPPGQSWDKVALSQYPRCPASADGETWTTNATLMWINKWVRPSHLTTRSSDAGRCCQQLVRVHGPRRHPVDGLLHAHRPVPVRHLQNLTLD